MTMTLENYQNSEIAALYDLLNPWGPDFDLYLETAQESSLGIADFCCGTGLLTARLGQIGVPVIGVDIANAMLAIARHREGAYRVDWRAADVRTVSLDKVFDQIFCTGHSFQCLLTDADQNAFLTNVYRHLLPGGLFVFETRNPQRRAWTSWNIDNVKTVSHPAVGPVQLRHTVTSTDDNLVHFDSQYRFLRSNKTITTTNRLRFSELEDVRRRLRERGFHIETVYGDWDRSPVQKTSPELIVLARRT